MLGRKPAHLADQQALVYDPPAYDPDGVLVGALAQVDGPIDATGGWFDAGDYVKFVQTSSYVDALMLFGVRQYPALLSGGAADFASEARFGLDWLQKMWNADTRTLRYQLGIGDGNGETILGDHDLSRLPETNDQLDVKPGDPLYFVKHRPALRAAGGRADQPEPGRPAGRRPGAMLPGLSYQRPRLRRALPTERAAGL